MRYSSLFVLIKSGDFNSKINKMGAVSELEPIGE
jgi:hypothetical protein